MEKQPSAPTGELLLRTLAMPSDTNPNGDIFGGWIMSQMDIAGGILAKEISCARTVTVAVDSIVFIKPVSVGDVVCCHGEVIHIGTTSMKINLEVWTKKTSASGTAHAHERFLVTKAAFTYVAIDSEGKKQTIDKRSRCFQEFIQNKPL